MARLGVASRLSRSLSAPAAAVTCARLPQLRWARLGPRAAVACRTSRYAARVARLRSRMRSVMAAMRGSRGMGVRNQGLGVRAGDQGDQNQLFDGCERFQSCKCIMSSLSEELSAILPDP